MRGSLEVCAGVLANTGSWGGVEDAGVTYQESCFRYGCGTSTLGETQILWWPCTREGSQNWIPRGVNVRKLTKCCTLTINMRGCRKPLRTINYCRWLWTWIWSGETVEFLLGFLLYCSGQFPTSTQHFVSDVYDRMLTSSLTVEIWNIWENVTLVSMTSSTMLHCDK